MIESFGNLETELIWLGRRSRRIPFEIQKNAKRKLWMIDESIDVTDLMIPPSNRLEKLKGSLKDYYSVRVNHRWRIIFKWDGENAHAVEITDYH